MQATKAFEEGLHALGVVGKQQTAKSTSGAEVSGTAASDDIDTMAPAAYCSNPLFSAYCDFESVFGTEVSSRRIALLQQRVLHARNLQSNPGNIMERWALVDLVKAQLLHVDPVTTRQKPEDSLLSVLSKSVKLKNTLSDKQSPIDTAAKQKEKIVQRLVKLYEGSFALQALESTTFDENIMWTCRAAFWIDYALFCEQSLKSVDEANKVLTRALNLCTHASTHSSDFLWNALVDLHLRVAGSSLAQSKTLPTARDVETRLEPYRQVIKVALEQLKKTSNPSPDLFRRLIYNATELGDTDEARRLFDQYCENPSFSRKVETWLDFADWELKQEPSHTAVARSEAVLTKALQTAIVEGKELLWVRQIKSRIQRGDIFGARSLYEGLLDDALQSCVNTLKLKPVPGSDAAEVQQQTTKVELTVQRLFRVHNLFHGFIVTFFRPPIVPSTSLVAPNMPTAEAVKIIREAWKKTVVAARKANLLLATPLVDAWREFEGTYGTPETRRTVDDVTEAPAKKRSKLFGMARDNE